MNGYNYKSNGKFDILTKGLGWQVNQGAVRRLIRKCQQITLLIWPDVILDKIHLIRLLEAFYLLLLDSFFLEHIRLSVTN